MMLRHVVCICLLTMSCARAQDRSMYVSPNDGDRERWSASVSRLTSTFLDNGQVVSRDADGNGVHLGDSLIWTGIALGVLGCDEGVGVSQALRARVVAGGGILERFEPLPSSYRAGNEVSLDGEIGLWFGFAARSRRCPAEAAELGQAWALRQQAVGDLEGQLHPNVDVRVPVGLAAARDAVGASLGVGSGPAGGELEAFGAVVATWARLVVADRAACFRVNLAWTAIRALEEGGRRVPPGWRDSFCAAAAPAGLPTVEHWCGREGLDAYLASYRPNEWEYRHQRCAGWESPDGGDLATPGLDELMALREKFGDAITE